LTYAQTRHTLWAMEAPVWFRWLGVAGIELRVGDEVLAIDPFFTRPPLWCLGRGRVEPDHALIAEKIERCHYVLVTHAHFDHVMDVPDVARNTGAMVLGSANTCRLLAACGLPERQVREVRAGERVELGGWRVDILPAEHIKTPGFSPGPLPSHVRPPLRLRDYRMDTCFSFLIQVGGSRLLDWRSVRAESAPRAEVLFVGVEDSRERYEALLRAVQPRLVIPIHWDDMFRPLSEPLRPYFTPPRLAWPPLRRVDLARFRRMIEEMSPGVRVMVPEAFRGVRIGE